MALSGVVLNADKNDGVSYQLLKGQPFYLQSKRLVYITYLSYLKVTNVSGY